MRLSWSLWCYCWQCWPVGSPQKQGVVVEQDWRRWWEGGGKPTAPAEDQRSLGSPLTSPNQSLGSQPNATRSRSTGCGKQAEISPNIVCTSRRSVIPSTSLQNLNQLLWSSASAMSACGSAVSWCYGQMVACISAIVAIPEFTFPHVHIGLVCNIKWGGGRRRRWNGN